MATHRNGDVASRVIVRFEEVVESMRLIRLILEKLPAGDLRATTGDAPENALGIGWVEGWRGEIMVALHTGKNNGIHRLHPHDPSWQNWRCWSMRSSQHRAGLSADQQIVQPEL